MSKPKDQPPLPEPSLLPRRWWQTLDEVNGLPATRGDEFPDGPPLAIGMGPPAAETRRDFFKLMGLSATAALAACRRAPEQKILPFTTRPDEVIPGVASWYASACGGCDAHCGLLVKTRDGRPIKVEGNPSHPVSRGAVCAVGQASLLGLYDGDRARGARLAGQEASWADVDRKVRAGLAAARHERLGIRLVLPWGLGPTEQAALSRLVAAYGDVKVVRFDALAEREAMADAYQALVGVRLLPDFRLQDADVIVGVGADFLGTWLAPGPLARQYATARDADVRGHMARHVQLESTLTITGAAADARHALAPSQLVPALAALVQALLDGASGPTVELARRALAALPAFEEPSFAGGLARELRAAGPRGVVLCGGDDRRAHALAALANALLGNQETTAVLTTPAFALPELTRAQLRAELNQGLVGALIFAGVNPALSDPELVTGLERVGLTVSTADRLDETAVRCAVHAPEGHAMEAWLDHAPQAGIETMGQPTVAPLFDTRPRLASWLAWAGETEDSFAFFKGRWQRDHLADAGLTLVDQWDNIVREGYFVSAAPLPDAVPFTDDAGRLASWLAAAPTARAAELELVLHESVALRDGAHANNGWLQELPDPITKLTWGNVVALAPARARAMGLADGDVVEVGTAAGKVRLPVLAQPGVAPNVAAVAVGYGRAKARAGGNAGGHGADAYPLATAEAAGPRFAGAAVSLTATGAKQPLALTQTHSSQEGRELVREVALGAALAGAAGEGKPGTGHSHAGHASRNGLWPEHPYPGHRWGLAVDLAKCTGCAACVVSCNAENNIPVVGELEVRRRREMHWLRIDRYYAGSPEDPEVVHQPMMCQHCENAPCETVCPVLATVHSGEGLNQQIYNRCVGTRYCANNCPTKVRRFNWFDYPHGDPVQRMVLNPDVVVRSRGVMEKCSMCVQRIEEGRAQANREARPLGDGDIRTACQQSCPTQAITFGDLNDPGSAVSRLRASGRAYHILEELNVKSQIAYLARVKNRGEHG